MNNTIKQLKRQRENETRNIAKTAILILPNGATAPNAKECIFGNTIILEPYPISRNIPQHYPRKYVTATKATVAAYGGTVWFQEMGVWCKATKKMIEKLPN